jgi:hypothetical protein
MRQNRKLAIYVPKKRDPETTTTITIDRDLEDALRLCMIVDNDDDLEQWLWGMVESHIDAMKEGVGLRLRASLEAARPRVFGG